MADLLAPDSDDEEVEPAAKVRKLEAPAAARPPAFPTAGGLQTGAMVELVGFASAAMNGARGRLGKFSESKGIWQVFLDNADSAKAIKPKNLKLLPPPGARAAEAAPVARPQQEARGSSSSACRVGEFHSMPRPKFVDFKTTWRPDDNMPQDNDANGWLEILRDVYMRNLREANQYAEPPPFHTIFEPMADPTAADEKALRQALTMQLQVLTRARYGEGQQGSSWGKSGGKGYGGAGRPANHWQPQGKGWRPTGQHCKGARAVQTPLTAAPAAVAAPKADPPPAV